jgi:glycosyltransferase involved in cell wall biosynthesis
MVSPRLVSVVLPGRDAAATIVRALASVQRQTLADWELIVVDDGSQDGTSERLREAARDEVRIRILRQEPRGIVAALNAGLAAAGGEFVARLDADDEMRPVRLAAQVRFLREHPAVGLVSSLVGFGGDRIANAGYARHVDWLNSLSTPEELALNRFIEAPVAHPSVMFRRELVEHHGGYRDGDFPEDYELWLRWAAAGVAMGKVPEELLVWHDRPGRLSRTDPRYDPEAFYRVKAQYLAEYLRRNRLPTVWIWGAGRPTRKRASHLAGHGVTIGGYVDIDPRKTGKRVGGIPVIRPDQLPGPGECFVLAYVSTRGARELIRLELRQRGWVEGRDFLVCA